MGRPKYTGEIKVCTVSYSCHNNNHQFGTEFIVNKSMRYLVMNFRPISMRLCKNRKREDIETKIYLARTRQQKKTTHAKRISMIYWKRNMIMP